MLPFLGPWGHLAMASKNQLPGPWWDHRSFAGCPGNSSSTYYITLMETGTLGSQKFRQDTSKGCCTLAIPVSNAPQRRKSCGVLSSFLPVSVLHIIYFIFDLYHKQCRQITFLIFIHFRLLSYEIHAFGDAYLTGPRYK